MDFSTANTAYLERERAAENGMKILAEGGVWKKGAEPNCIRRCAVNTTCDTNKLADQFT
jgi:hypothetical protein